GTICEVPACTVLSEIFQSSRSERIGFEIGRRRAQGLQLGRNATVQRRRRKRVLVRLGGRALANESCEEFLRPLPEPLETKVAEEAVVLLPDPGPDLVPDEQLRKVVIAERADEEHVPDGQRIGECSDAADPAGERL